MTIRTTFMAPGVAGLEIMPRLTPREIDCITAAVAHDEMQAIVANASSEVVAVATPEIAERIARHDSETLEELRREVDRALKEIATLKTIIGEVFAESDPAEHRWKLDEAARDVAECIGWIDNGVRELEGK